jgi:hypothetical protein
MHINYKLNVSLILIIIVSTTEKNFVQEKINMTLFAISQLIETNAA